MPRLFRESPLNSIWEGSGNVNALDVLRVLHRSPETVDAYRAEIEPALSDARLRAAAEQLWTLLAQPVEAQARLLVERMALLWQAALLARRPSNPVADLFIDSRIAGNWGRAFGTLAPSADLELILERSRPAPSVEYT
jgi:putative acyl-CoA dehydrogenase